MKENEPRLGSNPLERLSWIKSTSEEKACEPLDSKKVKLKRVTVQVREIYLEQLEAIAKEERKSLKEMIDISIWTYLKQR